MREKETKWERRDRKYRKRRSLDMVVSNTSIRTILREIGKKAKWTSTTTPTTERSTKK